MSLLRCDIDEPDCDEGSLHLTERRLRAVAVLGDHGEQRARFRDLVGAKLPKLTWTAR